jgi:hypothetical protein
MAIQLGREVHSDFIPKILLDGQQRLTSLGRVFDPATPKQDRILFNVIHEIFEPCSPRHEADTHWIDVTQLLTDEGNELDMLARLEEARAIDPKPPRDIYRRGTGYTRVSANLTPTFAHASVIRLLNTSFRFWCRTKSSETSEDTDPSLETDFSTLCSRPGCMRPPGEPPMKVLMIKRLLAMRSHASKPC